MASLSDHYCALAVAISDKVGLWHVTEIRSGNVDVRKPGKSGPKADEPAKPPFDPRRTSFDPDQPWDGLTTRGAVVGGTFGLVSSVVLTTMGPTIWSKVLGFGPAIFPYDSPALFTVLLTLLVCWLVSIAKAEPEKDWRLAQPSVAQYAE